MRQKKRAPDDMRRTLIREAKLTRVPKSQGWDSAVSPGPSSFCEFRKTKELPHYLGPIQGRSTRPVFYDTDFLEALWGRRIDTEKIDFTYYVKTDDYIKDGFEYVPGKDISDLVFQASQ